MVKNLNSLKPRILFIVLVLYIASLIVFDLSSNVIYSNILNIVLWGFFLLFMVTEKNYKLPVNNLLLSYLAFTAFSFSSVFWAVDFDLAFNYSMRLLIASINLMVLYSIFVHYKIQNAILYGILLGAFYNYMIAFGVITVHYETYEFGRFMGSVGNSNKLAKVMLISIFTAIVLLSYSNLKLYMRMYASLSILLSLFVIFLTVSKKAMVLAPLLLLTTITFKHLKMKNIVIAVMALIVVFEVLIHYIDMDFMTEIYELTLKRVEGLTNLLTGGTGDASSMERETLIVEGIDAFGNNPLLGNGLNNFRLFFGKYAHNNYIELLVGVGLIGTMLFYAFYMFIFKSIRKMPTSIVKRYFYTMVFILLAMDFATVSYYNKLVLFTLLYIYFVANMSEENPYVKTEVNDEQ